MGTTLRLKDGKREFIGNDRHFSDTVRSHMGDDAADWLNDRRWRTCMGLTNKALGNAFEAEFCKMLAAKGFWVHNMAQNSAGQPADVIAARQQKSWLIDCKVCGVRGFSLSRIEDNQWTAMGLWSERVSTEPAFALKLSDGSVYMMWFCEMQWFFSQGHAYMTDGYIRKIGCPFTKWVESICE